MVANRGSFAPGHAKVGGRKRGGKNKATADVKALAGEYGPEAIEHLAKLMRTAESEQAQVAAAKELLDRAYGKPPQAITGPNGGPLIEVNIELQREQIAAKLARISAAAEAARAGRLIEGNGSAEKAP
jgi:hypothetical protein